MQHEQSYYYYLPRMYQINELIDALKSGRTGNESAINAFREKYRSNDVLLIDDIQFIIGKDRTQEEFFNTFNVLYNAGKQIVVSSDKPPKEMTTLEEQMLCNDFNNKLWGDFPVHVRIDNAFQLFLRSFNRNFYIG